jgi:pyruvate, orthophosphate dikinase
MGKACLVGCRALAVDERRGSASLDGKTIREGDWIALNGASGEISLGRRAIVSEETPETAIVRRWREEAAA